MSDKFENVRFEFEATCDKAWQDEKTGKMYVKAVASDDKLDLQRDRMGKTALDKMAAAAKRGVPFLETHRSTFEFGKTVDGEIISVNEGGKMVNKFVATVELDSEFPQARKLFKEVALGTCKRQLSIGGKLNLKNRDAVSIEMTPSGLARTINDLDLDHIASTREKHAANPRTSFLEAIAKAMDDAEADGWEPEVSETVAKTVAAQGESVEDVKAGMSIFAKMGRLFKSGKGGDTMTTKAAKPGSEEETTTTTEDTTTKAGTEKEVKVVAAAIAEKVAVKLPVRKAEETSAHDLVSDIAILLSKRATSYDGKTEKAADALEFDRALYNGLWSMRFMLAKEIEKDMGATLGADEKAPMSSISDGGLYAPRDLSAGKVSGAYIPDKAPKGADTDIGSSGVTDAKRNIQAGGEVKDTAPTAKAAFKSTMDALAAAAKLPQSDDQLLWGKDFTPEMLQKSVGDTVQKAISEQTEVTKNLVLSAFEKMMEESGKDRAEVKKSVDGLGAALNTLGGQLTEAEARVSRLEKGGGISHSGPRGASDTTAPARGGDRKGGLWTGLFGKAADEALGKY